MLSRRSCHVEKKEKFDDDLGMYVLHVGKIIVATARPSEYLMACHLGVIERWPP
jgi:hypothetical protein